MVRTSTFSVCAAVLEKSSWLACVKCEARVYNRNTSIFNTSTWPTLSEINLAEGQKKKTVFYARLTHNAFLTRMSWPFNLAFPCTSHSYRRGDNGDNIPVAVAVWPAMFGHFTARAPWRLSAATEHPPWLTEIKWGEEDGEEWLTPLVPAFLPSFIPPLHTLLTLMSQTSSLASSMYSVCTVTCNRLADRLIYLLDKESLDVFVYYSLQPVTNLQTSGVHIHRPFVLPKNICRKSF